MAVPTFVLLLFVAAAVLAIWLHVRLGGRGPSSISQILLHVLGAILALRVARSVVGVSDAPGTAMVVIFAVLLPALVYVFLTSLWVLKIVRGAMPR